MVFSSVTFIYFYLPAVLALYFAVPGRAKNLVLALVSFIFYFYGEPKYTILMAASCLISYAHGIAIERFRGTKWQKPLLVSCVTLCLSALIYFKYADFIVGAAAAVIGREASPLRIALPIGISFYTFQALSYAVDVCRGEVKAQRNFVDFCAYLAFFPQLVAGPIVRYSVVERDLSQRTHSMAGFAVGVRRFVIGLGKKVLLANVLGEMTRAYGQVSQATVLSTWLYAVSFSMQIYFDFSGYSDMAIGMGRMFGFKFPENFNYPFISQSVAEFWRRWHMTLGSWFRDYVYIPLGGNRVKPLRWFLNALAVWGLTGLWHGAAWTYLAWGLYFALFLAFERWAVGGLLEKVPRAVRHAYVLIVVAVSFTLFGADSLGQAAARIGGLFGVGMRFADAASLYQLRGFAVTLAAAAIGATPLPAAALNRLAMRPAARRCLNLIEPAALLAIMALATAFLVDGSYNPFIYFRF